MQSIVVDNTVLVVLNISAFNRQGFLLDLNGTSAYLQPLVITAMPLSSVKA